MQQDSCIKATYIPFGGQSMHSTRHNPQHIALGY
jgi:hypothetical protein